MNRRYIPKRKYNNIITEIDGIKFHSRKEANRYTELKMMIRAGEITQLELQKQFKIEINGLKVCTYICDFYYDTTVCFTKKITR